MAGVTSDFAARLVFLMHQATANSQHVPGVVLQVVDRHGNSAYSGAAGLKGLGSTKPMTTDTVFWIASCTKLVSAVALMILVEQGKADLDSADLLEEMVPELKTVQILEDGRLRPKRNRITLRMLMTHVGIDWPLGMTSTSFMPSTDMRSRMAMFHRRADNLTAEPHFYRPAREEGQDYFQSAGAGLLSTVTDYSRVLAMLLGDGVSPHTQKRVLASETVDEMFRNQIPDYMGKYVTGGPHVTSRPDLCIRDDPTAEPTEALETYGWGLTMLLQTSPGAASFTKGSATGLCNCFWTVDREKGVAAVCFSQILPFGDPYVYPLWQAVEAVI
ncbi:beta-lactamase family protein [Grosmannia clavigera kw1407]|uniref:Beta-lactamase family protein n=1 Tax=Grosmannia clavigera (strain kw1407 / UAMH 11150) TaxID=655863 RepID=F0XDL1_GROCL|nr:beta-lactamase family protein [Grosmannia clavigera kw1407]EFX04583.1 beta-lactamase family protein [Grosmannia clavigera kw1407]